jgi:chromosomal replication initiation ATPase DnaA
MAYVDTINQVAAEYGLTRADIVGPSRKRPICLARWEAMRRMRAKRLSTSSIGRLLNRDHATVVHGLRRAG